MPLVLLHELDTLLCLSNEVRQHGLEVGFLNIGQFTIGVNFLDAIGAQSARGREEGSIGKVVFDKGTFNDAAGAIHGLNQAVAKHIGCVCHAQSGRTSTILGLDNFITAKLNTVGKRRNILELDSDRKWKG